MKTELYLNRRTTWYEIWDAIRVWLTKSPHSNFGKSLLLPSKLTNGTRKWSIGKEQLIARQLGMMLTVDFVKSVDGVKWTTNLYFKRATRSIYSRIMVDTSKPCEIKTPRIIEKLKKRFGQMNVSEKKRLPTLKTKTDHKPKETVKRHYRTRAQITLDHAVAITGFAKRTIQNLLKNPRNTNFPGLNVSEPILLQWAIVYKGEKVRKHWANMANHPIPISSLPQMLQAQLGFGR